MEGDEEESDRGGDAGEVGEPGILVEMKEGEVSFKT
jgi:hypothetical protein